MFQNISEKKMLLIQLEGFHLTRSSTTNPVIPFGTKRNMADESITQLRLQHFPTNFFTPEWN
jgi:hypothetical protein